MFFINVDCFFFFFWLEKAVCCVHLLSHVWLFATPWAIAHQLLCPWDFPGKNAAAGWYFLLQKIMTKGLKLCLFHWLHWWAHSLPLMLPGKVCVHDQSLSHVHLFVILWAVAHLVPLSMRFSRQESWSGLSCLSLGYLPEPGIQPASPVATALQADSLLLRHWGSYIGSFRLI